MTIVVAYYFEERYYNGQFISHGSGAKWTLAQCVEHAIDRKLKSPRSILRIVRETRETYGWSERKKLIR